MTLPGPRPAYPAGVGSPAQPTIPAIPGAPAASISTIPNSLQGTAGMTLSFNGTYSSGGQDDGYWNVTLPFSTTFMGTAGTAVAFGTNSYVTYGGGSTAYSGLSGSNPALRKVHVNSADRGAQRLYTLTSGTSPNRTHRVRFEGSSGTSGTAGSPTHAWEFLHYENNVNIRDLYTTSTFQTTGQCGAANTSAYSQIGAPTNWAASTGYRLTNTTGPSIPAIPGFPAISAEPAQPAIPGPVSLSLSAVNSELGVPSTTNITMNQVTVRNLFNKPTTQSQILMTDGNNRTYVGRPCAITGGYNYTTSGSSVPIFAWDYNSEYSSDLGKYFTVNRQSVGGGRSSTVGKGYFVTGFIPNVSSTYVDSINFSTGALAAATAAAGSSRAYLTMHDNTYAWVNDGSTGVQYNMTNEASSTWSGTGRLDTATAQTTNAGYVMGGGASTGATTVARIPFSTLASTTLTSLSYNLAGGGSFESSSAGYIAGGTLGSYFSPFRSTCTKYTFSTETAATSQFLLGPARWSISQHASGPSTGWWIGGYGAYQQDVTGVTYSTDTFRDVARQMDSPYNTGTGVPIGTVNKNY